MRRDEVIERLRGADIQPSSQRVAVAEYVLTTDDHPSADQVWARVKKALPVLSRATVYNTLNLFVGKGLLCQHTLSPGKIVFDPLTEPHHHFIDEGSGRIHDVPWDALEVCLPSRASASGVAREGPKHVAALKGFSVRDYQVVLRGRRTATTK